MGIHRRRNTSVALIVLLFALTYAVFGQSLQDNDQQWRERNSTLLSELSSSGIGVNSSILNALSRVPRHLFADKAFEDIAYDDIPLPGYDNGILPSPTDTLLAIQMLTPSATDKVLVAGNNAGYAAAVISLLAGRVYLIEETSAAGVYAELFTEYGFDNITVTETTDINSFNDIIAFERIFIHGSAPEISERLTERLAIQGNITFILAEEDGFQQIVSLRRSLLGDSVATGGSCYFPEITRLKVSN